MPDDLPDYIDMRDVLALPWMDESQDITQCNEIFNQCEQGIIAQNDLGPALYRYFSEKYPGQEGSMLFFRYGLNSFKRGTLDN